MPLLEQIDRLNVKQRLLALAVIIVVLVLGFYQYVHKPNIRTISGLETRLSRLRTDLQGLRAIAAKLPEFKAETDRLQRELDNIRQKLPQEREIPGLLEGISRAGIDSGLKYELFRPRNEVRKEFYSEVPVDIRVRGPFHSIAKFLDEIVNLPRVVNITSFSFGAAREEDGYLFISGTGLATTYRYNERG